METRGQAATPTTAGGELELTHVLRAPQPAGKKDATRFDGHTSGALDGEEKSPPNQAAQTGQRP